LRCDNLKSSRHQLLAFNVRKSAHPRTVFFHQLHPGGFGLRFGRCQLFRLHAENMAVPDLGVNRAGQRFLNWFLIARKGTLDSSCATAASEHSAH
jgi:hypothetical protein